MNKIASTTDTRASKPRVSVERSETETSEHGRQAARSEALLVHRDLRNPPDDESGLPPALTPMIERRRTRYVRRHRSSAWLIGEAREAAGREYNAEPGTKAADADWVRPPRAARCSWVAQDEIGVHWDGEADSPAHYSGLERCGSIWACPVCAGVIRATRAEEIERAAVQHAAAGGGLVFVTLTMRHGISDELATTLDAALDGWRRMIRGKAWNKFKDAWGINGYVRAVEITYGDSNGWHPHVHALLFTDEPLNEGNAELMKWQMTPRWQRYVTERGGGMPSDDRAVDVRIATDAAAQLAAYLSKVQDDGSAKGKPVGHLGAEVARSDMKRGRKGGKELRHRTPFELLDTDPSDEIESLWDEALWRQYHESTLGRRAITWSKGLKDRFDLDEKTDEEIIDETESADRLMRVKADDYRTATRQAPLTAARVLELVEHGDTAAAYELLGETAAQWEKSEVAAAERRRSTVGLEQLSEILGVYLDPGEPGTEF